MGDMRAGRYESWDEMYKKKYIIVRNPNRKPSFRPTGEISLTLKGFLSRTSFRNERFVKNSPRLKPWAMAFRVANSRRELSDCEYFSLDNVRWLRTSP